MASFLGAKGSNQTTSDLYSIDSASPGTPTSIGPIGFGLTGLCFDPTTGTLYGATNANSASHPSSLVTVDPVTGAGTFIGAFGTRVPDIACDSAGNMYGFSGGTGGLFSINKATGLATYVGGSGVASGGGLSFDSSDTLYGAKGGTSGADELNTFDTSTGDILTGVNFSGSPSNGLLAAATFSSTDVLYGIDQSGPGQFYLIQIDQLTGAITSFGNLPDRFDALVIASEADITLTPECGRPGASVSVDGTGFAPSTALSATFNGSALALGGTTTTDGSGSFTGATFVVPSITPGTYSVEFTDGSASGAHNFTITPPNTSCGFSTVLQTGDCVTTSNVCVTNVGSDPLNALLGTGGGHALWFVYTAPALGPIGSDVAWTITRGTLGAYNAGVVSGPCNSGTIQTQTGNAVQTTLAQSVRPFTGSTSGRSTSTQAVGVAAPATSGSYVQNANGTVTLTAHINSGETVHLEVDNYDGSAEGTFTVCVNLALPPGYEAALTFDNYFRPEQ